MAGFTYYIENPDSSSEGEGSLLENLPDPNSNISIDSKKGSINSMSSLSKKKNKFSKKKKILLTIGVILLILLILGVVFILIPGLRVKNSYNKLNADINVLKTDKNQKNLIGIYTEIPVLQTDLTSFHKDVKSFAWVSVIPVAGGYYQNADHALNAAEYVSQAASIVLKSALPVGQLFGYKTDLTSTSSTTATSSNSSKIENIIKVLPQLQPSLDQANPYISKAYEELKAVNPQYLPSEVKGIQIKSQYSSILQIFNDVQQIIPQLKQVVPIVSEVAGANSPVNYLILFQNDKEIRPTGGFITAYGFANLVGGKLQSLTSYNIYTLDQYYHKVVAPPTALTEYNSAKQWFMRDANISPDLPTSVQYIKSFYNNTSHMSSINGMILLDTQFVSNLLKVTGPVKVEGVTIDANNAAYEMEYFSEKVDVNLAQDQRKSFVSQLMKTIEDKILNSSQTDIGTLLTQAQDSLDQKHVQLYFDNQDAENYILSKNWGGAINATYNGDYFNLVEANLGGAKANFYIQRNISQAITKLRDGSYKTVATVTYTNNQPYDNWLSAPYKAWVRLYVPYGSKLISWTGVDGSLVVTNDKALNKTVFDDHIRVPVKYNKSDPPAKLTMTATYILPAGTIINDTLHELIQKQAGMNSNDYVVTFNGKSFEQTLNKDNEISL